MPEQFQESLWGASRANYTLFGVAGALRHVVELVSRRMLVDFTKCSTGYQVDVEDLTVKVYLQCQLCRISGASIHANKSITTTHYLKSEWVTSLGEVTLRRQYLDLSSPSSIDDDISKLVEDVPKFAKTVHGIANRGQNLAQDVVLRDLAGEDAKIEFDSKTGWTVESKGPYEETTSVILFLPCIRAQSYAIWATHVPEPPSHYGNDCDSVTTSRPPHVFFLNTVKYVEYMFGVVMYPISKMVD